MKNVMMEILLMVTDAALYVLLKKVNHIRLQLVLLQEEPLLEPQQLWLVVLLVELLQVFQAL